MRILFETATSHLKNNEDLALVTVIASSGATPRGAGAHMLVGESGRLYGTIGGGAVEHRSIKIAQKVIAEKASRAHDFSLTKDDVQALGMICAYFSPISLPRIKRCARSLKRLQNASRPEATSG